MTNPHPSSYLGHETEDDLSRNHVMYCSEDERLAFVSDCGLRHPSNQDDVFVGLSPQETTLLAVADGVSSSFNAQQASRLATTTLVDYIFENKHYVSAEELLAGGFEEAHRALVSLPFHRIPVPGRRLEPPATTLVAALQNVDSSWTIGWVGDSRAYHFDGLSLIPLTHDDSWTETVVSAGRISREDAEASRFAHAITQAIGIRTLSPQVRVIHFKPDRPTVMMLCSDGLWGYIGHDELTEIIRKELYETQSALEIAQALVDAANDAGGHDNVSVAIYIHDPVELLG